MFRFFKNCIFCDSKLPEKNSGEGEHVIPKNIYGFWHIYDICEKCKEYFGNNVDQLSIHEPLILQSIKILGLPDFEKYVSNIPFKADDVVTDKEKEILYNNGEFRIRVNKDKDEHLECPPDLSELIAKKWIQENILKKISNDEFDSEYKKFKDDLKPGEKIRSEKLGYEMTFSQYHKPEININSVKNISPLIAKICAIFLRYILSDEQLNLVPNYSELIQHARYKNYLSKCIIQFHPLFNDDSYDKVHIIKSYSNDNGIFIDVTFFAYVNWRVFVPVDSLIEFLGLNGSPSDSIMMLFYFMDKNNKTKEFCFRPRGSKEYQRYIINC